MSRGSATFPVREASNARQGAAVQSSIVDNLNEIAGLMFLTLFWCAVELNDL